MGNFRCDVIGPKATMSMPYKVSNTPPVAALILAGGENSRMSGQNKAGITVAGTPLLDHLHHRIKNQCSTLAVSIHHNTELKTNLPTIRDNIGSERIGPLAGVLSGLFWLKAEHQTCDWLLTLPVDAPFIPTNLCTQLLHGPAALARYAHWRQRDHFLTCLWHKDALATLEAFIHSRQRRVATALAELNAQAVEIRQDTAVTEFPDELLFFNINSPNELSRANQLYGKK